MIRKTVTGIAIILVLIVVVVFTKLNGGPITVDLAFFSVDTQKPLAFVVAFVTGWFFGLLCTSFFVIKLIRERRKTRKALRLAEAEVSSLRSLPLQDAGE